MRFWLLKLLLVLSVGVAVPSFSGSLVISWGANEFGECEIPATISSNAVAIKVGYYFSLAMSVEGSVVADQITVWLCCQMEV